MIQYRDWAEAQLKRQPSVYDWAMNLEEMADRALAICKVARDSKRPLIYIEAVYNLEKMAKVIKQKYPHRRR
jgi:hypothetical protein